MQRGRFPSNRFDNWNDVTTHTFPNWNDVTTHMFPSSGRAAHEVHEASCQLPGPAHYFHS
jgi:hypothetical protein